MNSLIDRFFLAFALCLVCSTLSAKGIHYSADSVIDEAVTVYDQSGKPHQLRSLIRAQAKPLNVIFIFGGGGMGHERALNTGGLWCPDSFEDLHILRSLKAAHGDELGIFPIAIPPAHHTALLGLKEGVFLNPDTKSSTYLAAVNAFIDSTQGAIQAGTIPAQTLYDLRYNLLPSDKDLALRDNGQAWHGAFRAANESQTYGVPSVWIVAADGRILGEPFRGNVYHPHGSTIRINYTLSDVVDALQSQSKND